MPNYWKVILVLSFTLLMALGVYLNDWIPAISGAAGLGAVAGTRQRSTKSGGFPGK